MSEPNDTKSRKSSRGFCSEFSAGAGEPLAGTAVHPDRNILIRWPKANWRYSLRIAAGMDGPVGAAIERVFKAGWRVNLIDRKSYHSELVRVYLLPNARVFDLPPALMSEFLDAVPKGLAELTRYPSRALETTLVLCCTHGKHDRCCAKFGFATYKAISAAAAQDPNFDVWEVTHLGGCRLSASVMVMPAMRKYGRMLPSDAQALIEAERDNRPYLPCYRGSSALSPPAQVAEIAALKHFATKYLIDSVQILTLEKGGSGYVFCVTSRQRSVRIRCVARQTAIYGKCSELDDGTEPTPKTVWEAEIVT